MRRKKALLAGFMAVSIAFSSVVIPVRAEVNAENVIRSSRVVAEETEIELPVEGMDREEINIGGGSLDEDLNLLN